jgi:hypothetical protein
LFSFRNHHHAHIRQNSSAKRGSLQMARFLCLVPTLTLGIIISQVSASASVQSCPRSLASVLETPPCTAHRLHLATTTRVVMAPTGDASANVCVDTLRRLFPTAASLPCSTILTPLSLERRLGTYIYVDNSGPFEGKLRCKFDSAAPLNATNLTQEFILECSEINKPYDYTWVYWVLGILGGAVVVFLLLTASWSFSNWRTERRRQARYEAEMAEARLNNPRPAPLLDDHQRQALIEVGAAPRVNAS